MGRNLFMLYSLCFSFSQFISVLRQEETIEREELLTFANQHFGCLEQELLEPTGTWYRKLSSLSQRLS